VHNHWIHYKDLLFRAMADRGLDFVVLFTALGSIHRLGHRPEEGAYPFRIGHNAPYETVSPLSAATWVWRELERVRPACLIISGWYDAAGWAAWLWGRLHNVPMVLWAESNVFDRPRHAALEAVKRCYLKPFRAAHVYGRSNLEYLRQLGFPVDRIFTIRAVADTARFRPSTRPRQVTSAKKLLFVGRLAPEKNLDRLLVAMSRLVQDPAEPRLLLRIVGHGTLERELRALAAQLGLEPFVEFAGHASQSELPAIYASADGLVLPSISEPWGLVVNEAMCCGLPAIVSDRCGCAADLVNPETGWTFKPDDETGLAAILDEFADCLRERLAAMGAAARSLAVQYSPDRSAAIVAETIRGAGLPGPRLAPSVP
jgi:glycosyltransferase involved in cell wall biosynthesis